MGLLWLESNKEGPTMSFPVSPEMAYNAYNGLSDSDFESLPEYGGYRILRGMVGDFSFTALFGDEEDVFEPAALFQHDKDEGEIEAFIDGMNHQDAKAKLLIRREYARGFDNGVAFIQNGFFALLGKGGASFVQGIVNEMKWRESE